MQGYFILHSDIGIPDVVVTDGHVPRYPSHIGTSPQ
jgi:hypothetical protein